MPDDIIKKVSKQDMLNSFYNKHMEMYVSAVINTIIFRNKKEDEIVGQVQAGQTPQGFPISKNVKAKEALFNETTKMSAQKAILDAIQYLEDNLNKL